MTVAAPKPRRRAPVVSKKKAPTRGIEKEMWDLGHDVVVGIDEVGRGAWAGPLSVGAAIVPRDGVTDRSAGAPAVTSASSASTRSAISPDTTELGGGSSSPEKPGSRRRSSASVGRRSPGPMSPGRSRSLHGTHSGARTASGIEWLVYKAA